MKIVYFESPYLCCHVRMTWTQKSIQVEGTVCFSQLSICAQMLDSEGLRQLSETRRKKRLSISHNVKCKQKQFTSEHGSM